MLLRNEEQRKTKWIKKDWKLLVTVQREKKKRKRKKRCNHTISNQHKLQKDEIKWLARLYAKRQKNESKMNVNAVTSKCEQETRRGRGRERER
jgi:hypothetical protein